MTSPRNIAENLFSELKLDHLKGAKREEILSELEEHFSQVVITTLLSRMSEDQFEEFKKAISSENIEEETAILTAKVPGLAEILEEKLQDEIGLLRAVMTS